MNFICFFVIVLTHPLQIRPRSSSTSRLISVPVLPLSSTLPIPGASVPAPQAHPHSPRTSVAPAVLVVTVAHPQNARSQPAFLVPVRRAPVAVEKKTDAPPAVPDLPPMFYATYRRGSNGEVLDPALILHGVQAQKSLYFRTKACRYWNAEGVCPKAEKCTLCVLFIICSQSVLLICVRSIHDPALAAAERTSPSTFIEEVEQAPTQDEPAAVQPTVTISHVQQQVQHEATLMLVSTPSVHTPCPHLPPVRTRTLSSKCSSMHPPQSRSLRAPSSRHLSPFSHTAATRHTQYRSTPSTQPTGTHRLARSRHRSPCTPAPRTRAP